MRLLPALHPILLCALGILAATAASGAEPLYRLPPTPVIQLDGAPTPESAVTNQATIGDAATHTTATDTAADTAECVADPETLCLLGGQIEVRVRFRNQRTDAGEQQAHAAPLGDRTGTFWFFREDNVELVIKALDGRQRNGHFWIFLGSLSDLEFFVDARAVASGDTTTYYNPPGHLFGLADLTALDTNGAGALCGTFQGLVCSDGFFCDLEGGCNVADASGTCVDIPEVCPDVFEPVCGCDGVTYGNDCERRAAQVRKDREGACSDGT